MNIKRFLIASFIILTMLFIYYPGLYGGFIFDDMDNLINLSIYQNSTGLDKYINYILSYQSGSLKRPVSTLSFLLNASDWPANPFFFKVTNLIIHLINGWLLFKVSKKILVFSNIQKHDASIIAVISALIWLAHPFFVSTVLYSVQRMTMLPVLFSLIGMIIYLQGRVLLGHDKRKGNIYLFISIFIFTTLATLSKENGILLPFLIYLIEIIILKNSSLAKLNKWHKYILFFFPMAVIILSLLYKTPGILEIYEQREFTLYERLLTESRVLVTYLYHLLIPSYFTEGVFTDGYLKSISLFNPISTFFCLLIIFLLNFFAILNRNKTPILSFSIIFFFLSHLIESTFIPLELYFEHRNYLPSLFLPLFFSVLLLNLIRKKRIFIIIPIILISYLMFLTNLNAKLWGNNLNLHIQSADKFPKSIRATTMASSLLDLSGQTDRAIELLKKSIGNNDNIELMANLLTLQCKTNTLKEYQLNQFNNKLKKVKFTISDTIPFNNFLSFFIRTPCINNNLGYAFEFIDSIKNNDGYKNDIIKVYTIHNLSLVYLYNGDYEEAYVQSLKFIENVDSFARVAKILRVAELYILRKEFAYSKKILDEIYPILYSSMYKRDIYSHKKQFMYYYQIIDNQLSNKDD